MAIRHVTPVDADAIRAIYAPLVRDTAITFELEVPTVSEIQRRIAGVVPRAPWLVLERDGHLVAYAYGHTWRERPAYRWTIETSIYVDDRWRGRGIGRELYADLLDRLRRQGFALAIGGVTLPNAPSVALHERLGFHQVGVHTGCGFKLGRWWDVMFLQKELLPREGELPPPAPPER